MLLDHLALFELNTMQTIAFAWGWVRVRFVEELIVQAAMQV